MSLPWNLGIPLMRRHPFNSRRRGRCRKIRGSKCFDAPNATDGEWHEKGSFHHCCQMFWHGSLNSTLLMEQGGVHTCIWPYYFSGISFPPKNSGRWPMYLSEFIWEGIKDIPLQKQWTQRKLVTSLGVSKMMVHCWIVDSTIQVHSNSLKPVLTEENKVVQLIMALESQDPQVQQSSLTLWTVSTWMRSGSSSPARRRDISLCWRRRTLSGA